MVAAVEEREVSAAAVEVMTEATVVVAEVTTETTAAVAEVMIEVTVADAAERRSAPDHL